MPIENDTAEKAADGAQPCGMLEVRHLKKEYKSKNGVTTKALNDVSLVFPETGMVFILGKSGSGKSTLLNVCGGLDRMDGGEIIIKGKSSKDFSAQDFDSYRNTFVGFVFQEYNILNEFTVEQNIAQHFIGRAETARSHCTRACKRAGNNYGGRAYGRA